MINDQWMKLHERTLSVFVSLRKGQGDLFYRQLHQGYDEKTSPWMISLCALVCFGRVWEMTVSQAPITEPDKLSLHSGSLFQLSRPLAHCEFRSLTSPRSPFSVSTPFVDAAHR